MSCTTASTPSAPYFCMVTFPSSTLRAANGARASVTAPWFLNQVNRSRPIEFASSTDRTEERYVSNASEKEMQASETMYSGVAGVSGINCEVRVDRPGNAVVKLSAEVGARHLEHPGWRAKVDRRSARPRRNPMFANTGFPVAQRPQ